MSSQLGFIDIILLAIFAGFIILRLRNILGRKTGHQAKPMNRYFPKGMEVLQDIENNEAIKSGNVILIDCSSQKTLTIAITSK